ncbi:tetratricopeptide repeat protein 37 [Uranotaenia lowii]|uniref:tetratricopeptide repeat protein 37 n=1 Tax=Uranotaenia lowii TaxID=190385 RepID=UPI00247A10FA|nr:tetratricopeptide repeat protein 37 [Uranotaenia lowii]
MSSKELKAALKEAREAIKIKKFSEAIKLCNKILKEDAQNYMALLLMGASYQDMDRKEAAVYLKRALDCGNDPTVALQGLLNCVEDKELPDVCGKLLNLTPDKYSDLHGKLLAVALRGECLDGALKILESEINLPRDNEMRITSAYNCLSKILLPNAALETSYESLVQRTLEHDIQNREDPFLHEKMRRYLKLLQRLKQYETLAEASLLMYDRFQNDIYPLEWICKVFVEKLVDESWLKQTLHDNIELYVDAALAIKGDSVLALVAKGMLHYENQNFKQAEEVLKKAYALQPNWSICVKTLVEVYMQMRLYGLAECLLRQSKITDSNFFITLVEDGNLEKLEEANAVYKELKPETEILYYYAKLKLLLKDTDQFESHMENLKNVNFPVDALDVLNALYNLAQNNTLKAVEILKQHENSCTCLLELVKLYYDVQDFENSFLCALKATKLEPNNSKCFFWLGKLYQQNSDSARARKCFEKCIALNPSNKDAIILLSSIYRKQNEWEANSKLLQNSVSAVNGSSSAWAQLQLGLHHLGQQNYDEAIAAFRTVLRYDINNITSWEGLADAYMNRGSYVSAIRVFEKINELQPDNPYPKLQQATIKNILKHHKDALLLFEELLEKDAKYFPAIKGIAESHFGLCYYRLDQRQVGRSRDHAQLAVDYFSRALKLKPTFVCLWKQMGNILDTVASFPESKSHLLLEGSLAGVNHRSQACIEGEKLFELAGRFYSRALKLNMDDNFLWYELATNNYRRALKYVKDKEGRRKLLTTASEAAKQAIKLDPIRWQNWNLLGVISATDEINNLALAQHCFIEAVTIDKKTSAVSWSNLGVLYLLEGSVNFANKAFSRAQQSDTTFPNAWIGQALIAEQIGQADEAMDLFRHCTQLGYHSESALGYAHWVCSILNEEYQKNKRYQFSIENMHALPLSHDSISWHCNDKESEASVEALHFQGFISIKLGLWKTAELALRKASVKASGIQRDKILCELGHCLIKQKKFTEAVDCFDRLNETTYHATVGKAYAYFKAGQYQESYAEYESALNWLATTDQEKAYALIAMSAMVYAFQGEADAKTILFQCITLPEPPIEALFSACSLGLLHKDSVLTDLVIKELRKYENDPKNGHHVVYLVSQYLWANKQKSQSLAYLVSQVHKYPARPKLRQILAVSLLKNHRTPKQNLIVASSIAQSALVLDLHDQQSGSTRAVDAAKWLAVASEAVRPVDERKRRILAQKAVHVDPTCKEAWSALIRISLKK